MRIHSTSIWIKILWIAYREAYLSFKTEDRLSCWCAERKLSSFIFWFFSEADVFFKLNSIMKSFCYASDNYAKVSRALHIVKCKYASHMKAFQDFNTAIGFLSTIRQV